MNLAIHNRRSVTPSTPTERRVRRVGHRSWTADYIADIALVALLASPFMLFEAPSTLPEAVVASRAGPTNVVQPAPAAGDPQTATADGR
jgi:hypothetical protein